MPYVGVTFFRNGSTLAMRISSPQWHFGNSVEPGTNKRSIADMGNGLTAIGQCCFNQLVGR
jgi:hypothetical protein